MPTDAPGGAPPATKGKKKTPTWYWVAGGVGLVLVYYLYEKKKTSAAAAAVTAAPVATGAGSSAGTAASSYGNAGDLSSLLPYLQGAQSATTGATASSGVFTPPTGQTSIGSGYGQAAGTEVVTDASGNQYQQYPVGTSYANLLSAGQSNNLFYQPSPGIFLPITYQVASSGAANNAPIYSKIPVTGAA